MFGPRSQRGRRRRARRRGLRVARRSRRRQRRAVARRRGRCPCRCRTPPRARSGRMLSWALVRRHARPLVDDVEARRRLRRNLLASTAIVDPAGETAKAFESRLSSTWSSAPGVASACRPESPTRSSSSTRRLLTFRAVQWSRRVATSCFQVDRRGLGLGRVSARERKQPVDEPCKPLDLHQRRLDVALGLPRPRPVPGSPAVTAARPGACAAGATRRRRTPAGSRGGRRARATVSLNCAWQRRGSPGGPVSRGARAPRSPSPDRPGRGSLERRQRLGQRGREPQADDGRGRPLFSNCDRLPAEASSAWYARVERRRWVRDVQRAEGHARSAPEVIGTAT